MSNWPTINTTNSTGYKVQGVSTIRWGTADMKGTWSAYVITKFSQKRIVENIKLTNGVGLTTSRIQLLDGHEWTITVRDDTSMDVPAIGTEVMICDAAGLVTTLGESYKAVVTESSYDTAPKQAGERNITVERLTLIETT